MRRAQTFRPMYSLKFPVITAFAILFLLLSLVQSTDIQAGPVVERDVEARFTPNTHSNTLAKKGHELEGRKSTNVQEAVFLGGVGGGQPCDEGDENQKVYFSAQPRLNSSNHSTRHLSKLDSSHPLLLSSQPHHQRRPRQQQQPPHLQNNQINVSAPNLAAHLSRHHVVVMEAAISALRVLGRED
jgi:hypothetical protein